jgi:hypothetical protein
LKPAMKPARRWFLRDSEALSINRKTKTEE